MDLEQMAPVSIAICAPNGDMMCKLHADGRVEMGEGYTPDDAARRFWEDLSQLSRASYNAGFEAGKKQRERGIPAEFADGEALPEPEPGNVVLLDTVTSLTIPVDRILDAAKAEGLMMVCVAGYTGGGEDYFASSTGDGPEILWLLERMKQRTMNGGYE